jgi:hypothetical protein
MEPEPQRHTRAVGPQMSCETRPVISSIFGHQGGWDEALMVLVPIALFVGLLLLANKRAKAIQAKRAQTDPTAKGPERPETSES